MGKVIHWEFCKKFKFDYTNKWYMHNPETVQKKKDSQNSLGFRNTSVSSNLGQTTKPSDSQQKKKKRTGRIVDVVGWSPGKTVIKQKEIFVEIIQTRTHKWCTLMDPHTWPNKSRTTSTNIHSATMWGYGMLSWRPA